ncbi:STY4534 family ICE replication protein [Pseudomonas sp. KFB-139]|uniref:STY4534 family ICE replication protein n=1 Tax=Pseudomonas serbiensis TaxID=3064350 RepID=A0ABT9CXP1_9PSED|nr:STY4534 family ICE replication protein [Pseudomonas sp. KFB-138]MDO7930278.1 STY4534 family ICE replication protein [Pseudomonas sp. KFB-138]
MSNSNETKYFDIHTTGIGYLNRIREVKPKKGNPFMAVTIAALHGKSDDVEYTYIDCNVVGEEADYLIRRCIDAVNADKKVLVSFRVGDIWPDVFTYEHGPKKGQTSASLKGRLLHLSWIKVNGVTVHEAKPKDQADASSDGNASNGSTTSNPAPTEVPAPVAEASFAADTPQKPPRSRRQAA